MDENIRWITSHASVLTALSRVQAFSRFLMKDGKVNHLRYFFFCSLSVSSFVSLCLIIQLKYPENYREWLRTKQVNWMLIMKSSNIFRGRHLNKRRRNTSSMQMKYSNIRSYNISKQIQLIKVFRNSFLETVCIFQKWFYPCPNAIKFSPVIDYELEFVKM